MKIINDLSPEEIQQCLNKQIPSSYDVPTSPGNSNNSETGQYPNQLNKAQRKAAVLIPFLRIEESWHILFIRRSIIENDMHSGQVAFVGGKHEENDPSIIHTALRETHEEIGIDPNDVNVLGKLNPHYTVSRFEVTPVIATVAWPYDLTLQKSEVSHAFTLPLDWLADENNHEIRYREVPNVKEPIPVLYFKEYEGELLWGATARMTDSLIKTLKNEPVDY
ncbi:CoA pyrophosphatase [Cocleimonas sp. KMM 6892]|uniref:NUDIX hydrolase n=1 Tax=unclassified Cocleimonas TaxID=2639732 RepID=UPI002DBF7FD8|nr:MULTISPECIES: CoA pyrophosphatase [unclassified Cocleimonas]MEB8434506.1 CoA pyrophosphatase [Cocleimonas sp. KMM 6892]MEC4717399.1 CoA pyrophosphatase [Cocleimonas sp. KMM 6895]MEC4746807.1 CoA pyrophosphatase [Cocleimonas sp. KMM 6896]